jgi:ATP-dependent Clp protease ATP-binding subunit ClpB
LEEIVVNAGIHNKTELTDAEIKEVLAQKTGIPIETLNAGDKATLLGLGEELEKVVVGQEVAVKSVVQSIQRSRVGLKNPNRPIGSFLFMGPTGVGKTEFAKQLARLYFQDEKAFMRFDMSEYSEAHTSQKLIGAPPGYMGYEEGGTLTNYVLHKPYCLLLFDEVEKAHPRIFDLFLQILDDGRLTDSKGQLVNFTNTILIFTSNIGSDKIATEAANPASLLYSDPTSFFADHIVPLLKDFLRIELINRFDEVIPFLPLNKEKITRILMLKLEKLKAAVAKQGYKIEFAPADLQKLAELCYSPVFGAREIDRMLNKYVENPVTEILLHNSAKPGDTIYWKFAQ